MARSREQLPRGAEWSAPGILHLEGVSLSESDRAWMTDATHVVARSIKAPPRLFSSMLDLKWLQIYGGSMSSLDSVRDSKSLRYLEVWNVRELEDLDAVSTLSSLEFLSLYGLKRVHFIPSLKSLKRLERVDLGRMPALERITGILEAPHLEELTFVNTMKLDLSEAEKIAASHVDHFAWYAEDAPDKMWMPFVEKVGKVPADPLTAEDWFSRRD